MKDDYVLHLEQDNLTLVADSSATRPGTKATLAGAFNQLTLTSDGNAVNDRSLHANELEVVTTSTIRQYVLGILNNGGIGLKTANTPSLRMVGQGIMNSPLEAQVTLPAASETERGIVKVVNEGSHGYPCPGISDRTMAGVYNMTDKYFLLFRNGADDLEKDVFISYYYTETGKYEPTAERLRLPSLPITAKPLNVIHSGKGAIFLNTTDGLFVLLAVNTNWKTWRAIKINFAEPHDLIPTDTVSGGEFWRGWYAFVIGTTLYINHARLNNSVCTVALWTGTITAASSITMTFRPLTGVNANGTAQTGVPYYKVFDSIWGSDASKKCFAYNADGYWAFVDTAHHGDDVDWVIEGTKMRVCHDGFNYASRVGSDMSTRHNISYLIDLASLTVTPDKPYNYPIPFTRTGWPHPAHNQLMAGAGGNHEFSPIRSNGMALWLETDNIFTAEIMGLSTNVSGLSDIENLRSGSNVYDRVHVGAAGGGAYGSPVTMGWGGMHFITDTIALGKTSAGRDVMVEVDPYGSYGPTVDGYGPTNNRTLPGGALARQLRNMISYYDGDSIKLQGSVINDDYLSTFSQLGESGPEIPISMERATYNALVAEAIAKYASTLPGIVYGKINLPIHRIPGMPYFGSLQVLHRDPNVPTSLVVTSIIFDFSPSQVTGTVRRVTLGQKLYEAYTSANVRPDGLTSFDSIANSTPNSICRLDDGGYVYVVTGARQAYVGNASIPQFVVVWNPKTKKVERTAHRLNYDYLRDGWLLTKDFGWGYSRQSDSGESYALYSYGKSIASVVAGINTGVGTMYTLVMSRTDAGDNVAISQFAASNIRTKILTLVPPARKVQGMDMTQDRTITKAMLANADRIPNQRDSTYPVQQRHIDSLSGKALKTHTHTANDYILNDATRISYGVARLGALEDGDVHALGVTETAKLITEVNRLWSRPKSVSNLDPSIQIDVEI